MNTNQHGLSNSSNRLGQLPATLPHRFTRTLGDSQERIGRPITSVPQLPTEPPLIIDDLVSALTQ
jgi:hypothetical protein